MRRSVEPTQTRGSGEHGATAVEYSILVSLIAAVIALIVTTLGGQVVDLFNSLAGQF
jgi:pilus assembly protein Flp/PilA